MGQEYPGNVLPSPGYKKGNYANDEELLYSTVGYTQKGVTIEGGQGVLNIGTVLARKTDTKKYTKFASGGGNGTGTAVGVLRQSVDTGTLTVAQGGQDFQGNIVIRGILKRQYVSSANGGTSAILTAFTGSREDAVLGTFTF